MLINSNFVVPGDTQDDLRQLLHESENNAQRLLAEVQAQEQEQVSNKMEMEKVFFYFLHSLFMRYKALQ